MNGHSVRRLLGILVVVIGLIGSGFVSAEVVLRVFSDPWTEEQAAVLNEVIREFEAAHPGITIDWIRASSSDVYYDQLLMYFASGNGPDLFFVRPANDSVYYHQGLAYDIHPLVEAEREEIGVDDFLDAQLLELKLDGKWWCLPYDYSCIVMFYNTAEFSQAGLPYPTDSWTWDDVIVAAEKLKRVDANQQVQLWGFGDITWMMTPYGEGFIQSFGGELFAEDLTRSVAASQEVAEALAIIQEFGGRNLFPYNVAEQPNTIFEAGRAAMTLVGSWALSYWSSVLEGIPFDVAMLPQGKPGQRVVSATGGAWAMGATTRHVEEAWAFLKWLTSPENQRRMLMKVSASLPPRKALLPDWLELLGEISPKPLNFSVVAEQILHYGRNVSPVGFNFGYGQLLPYLWPLVTYEMSPVEVSVKLEHDLNIALQRVRRYLERATQ